MDGVFMRKMCKRLLFLAMAVICFYTGWILGCQIRQGSQAIDTSLSDLQEDPAASYQPEALLDSLRQALEDATDLQQAETHIQAYLPKIEALVTQFVNAEGPNDLWSEMVCHTQLADLSDIICDLQTALENRSSEDQNSVTSFCFQELWDRLENFFARE